MTPAFVAPLRTNSFAGWRPSYRRIAAGAEA